MVKDLWIPHFFSILSLVLLLLLVQESMANPLSLLRQIYISGKEIIEHDEQVILGEFSWPKNTKTNYRMWLGKGSIEKKYYTLETLVFFLKNMSLIHPVYAREAAAKNISAVRRPDRKELLAYLKGEIANCPSIDESARWELPEELPNQVIKLESAEYGRPEINIAKKPRLENTHVQKVNGNNNRSKESSSTIDDNKSLSEVMSLENIAAIKAKRLAKKRKFH